MSTKAQMEIFGLVVIVILLSLGLLFAVVILSKGPSEETVRVRESIQASNFLNTMMGTHSYGCGRRTVRELLQNCALATYSDGQFRGATTCDDGITTTCTLSQQLINTMLEKTLGTWGKTYHFYIESTSDAANHIEVKNGDCTGEREGASRPEKVRGGMDLILNLHICQS